MTRIIVIYGGIDIAKSITMSRIVLKGYCQIGIWLLGSETDGRAGAASARIPPVSRPQPRLP